MQLNVPMFGASLTVSTPASAVKDLDAGVYQAMARLAEARDMFDSRVKAIRDEKDPLALSVNVTAGRVTATISSRANGYKQFETDNSQDLIAFVNQVVTAAEEMAPTLVSEEEKREKSLNAAQTFLNRLTAGLGSGDYEFVSKGSGRWAGEVGFHCRSSEAVVLRIGDEQYSIDKTVGRGVQYTITRLTDDAPTLAITIHPERDNGTSVFTYTDKTEDSIDLMNVYAQAENESDKIKYSSWITRTKQAIQTVENLRVFTA